jgi:hypothetical protein
LHGDHGHCDVFFISRERWSTDYLLVCLLLFIFLLLCCGLLLFYFFLGCGCRFYFLLVVIG